MNQHFIDANGNYFVAIDPIETPSGAIAVPARPAAHWNWNGQAWVEGDAPPTDPKIVGIEFEGVMCSATAADQAGLAAVLLAIQLQGAAFKPTRFYFENGNTLVITLGNWQALAAEWLPFRQSFFEA